MLRGHVLTLAPFFDGLLWPPVAPTAEHFVLDVPDEKRGQVRLTGRLHVPIGARTVLLVVHGLGGDSGSAYAVQAARAAAALGIASLRMDLRGASLRGDDFYHAGLTRDLHAVIDALHRFENVLVVGYSLGGHLTLKLASESPSPRVRALCAVCPPLDLGDSQAALDRPAVRPYLHHVLLGLKKMYRAVAAHGNAETPLRDVLAIDRIRAWDERVIAPRFGFEGAADYYRRMSVAPRLERIVAPTLLVTAPFDPMIPGSATEPHLTSVPPALEVRAIEEGGHVGFPSAFDLGEQGARGLAPQVVSWLARHV